MKVALLGLGLIGGSIARALREDPASVGPLDESGVEIVAWTPTQTGPRDALAAGVIDSVGRSIAETVDGAALVILCAPPIAMTAILDELVICRRSGRLADGAVVTDVASTKVWIAREAAARRSADPRVVADRAEGTDDHRSGITRTAGDSDNRSKARTIAARIGDGDPKAGVWGRKVSAEGSVFRQGHRQVRQGHVLAGGEAKKRDHRRKVQDRGH